MREPHQERWRSRKTRLVKQLQELGYAVAVRAAA
jgi:ABC-type xylose transport system substrate-binding protein